MPFIDAMLNVVKKYKNHPSITKIKMSIKTGEKFVFQSTITLEVRNESDQLNCSKKTNGELSTAIVKAIADDCLE